LTTTSNPHVGAAWLQLRHEVYRVEYDDMVRGAGFRAGDAVLDAGCGAGTHIDALAGCVGERGSITACDVDAANIAAAREHLPVAACSGIHVCVASIENLPFDDGCFDGVWCANVLQYLDDLSAARAVAELSRVLRRDGVVAVKDSDMLLWRMQGVDPLLLPRLAEAGIRDGASDAGGSLRGPDLRVLLREAGLRDVHQTTVLLERHAPLRRCEREMYGQWLIALCDLAQRRSVSATDREVWRRLADIDDANHPLMSRHFAAREGQVLLTATVP
jgi:SAM-dependent methyltransferase